MFRTLVTLGCYSSGRFLLLCRDVFVGYVPFQCSQVGLYLCMDKQTKNVRTDGRIWIPVRQTFWQVYLLGLKLQFCNHYYFSIYITIFNFIFLHRAFVRMTAIDVAD